MNSRQPSASGKGLFIGLDLGGTSIKVGLGTNEGELLWEGQRPTRADQGCEAVLQSLVDAGDDARKEAEARGAELAGVGLGAPGVIDPRTGKVLYDTGNLPNWGGVDLYGLLDNHFRTAVRITNDANAAAYAEAKWGAAKGCRSVVMATVGTGLGGGAIVEGILLQGAWGAGMELGHIPFRPGGRVCGCGTRGCLEAYAAARGLRNSWLERLAEESGRPIEEFEELELREMLERARDGEELPLEVLREGADALSIGLLTAAYMLNPECIVIGGGVVDGFEPYVQWVEDGIRARGLAKVTENLCVKRAHFGNQAGVIGAMAYVADSLD